jgi:hypothetical protein
VKRLIFACLLVAACNNKPTTFGIDVEARTSTLPAAVKNAIVSARLVVSGAEAFNRDIPGAAKAAQSGTIRFRYVPGVRSGTISIFVAGLDAGGTTVAGGTAPSVTIVDGKAVDAVLTLAVNGNGIACSDASECMSGSCVDGVCCNTACDGVCESCGLPGTIGQCTPAPSGEDPDNDCVGKTQLPDGGTGDEDGGTSVTPVVGDNPQACGGTCNGQRACGYAAASTSCGAPYCPVSSTVGAFECNGNGVCSEKDTMCSDFNCTAGACRTSCTQDSDCQATDFCNLNIAKCVPRHVDGTTCAMGNECKTGFCYSGVCCNTTCGDSTQSCNNPGNVGKCQCTGHACPNGVACVLFFKDGDVDGFGDRDGTLTNAKAVAGCTGDTPPSGFVADNTDCDDGDANAKPGQTQFFGSPSMGKGLFDYNCDGTLQKGFGENTTGSCQFCAASGTVCTRGNGCSTTTQSSSFGCFGIDLGGTILCRLSQTSAFTSIVNCGQTATYTTCGKCAAAGGQPVNTFSQVQQTCH